MKRLLAVIDAEGKDVQAVLAAEALRKAAQTEGRSLEIKMRGSRQLLDAVPDDGTTLLFVGNDDGTLGRKAVSADGT